MIQINKLIGPYRVVSENGINGQLYKITADTSTPCILIGQWYVYQDRIIVEYDFPQEVDCIEVVTEALQNEI